MLDRINRFVLPHLPHIAFAIFMVLTVGNRRISRITSDLLFVWFFLFAIALLVGFLSKRRTEERAGALPVIIWLLATVMSILFAVELTDTVVFQSYSVTEALGRNAFRLVTLVAALFAASFSTIKPAKRRAEFEWPTRGGS